MEFEKELSVQETGIEGLKVVELSVHGDPRGWFKENWQRAKMVALGIPDMRVVQNNVSFNARRGVTRGVHAEPWDKFVSVAAGSVFGAWVDLRQGSATYGRVFTCTLDPSRAIYVPRGVGNSFQALEDGTAYTYLVDAHWSAELRGTYTFVSLADPALGIEWPIPLSEATLSEADRHHPMLADVVPMAPRRTLVTGCRGQLGRAVRALAEGESGGPLNTQTYVLIANPTDSSASVRVTVLSESGAPETQTYTVGANSRFNIALGAPGFFPSAAGTRVGLLVESTDVPVVVERAMYWDVAGQAWAAGTNAVATRLP